MDFMDLMGLMISHRRLHAILLACLGLLLTTAAAAKLFVPDLEPWDEWVATDATSQATIDHSLWQQILNLYLITETEDEINRFDYAAVTMADRSRLQSYIDALAALDPRDYNRQQQRSYWINLYNALTVKLVLDKYPVKSIRRINGGLLGTGPWNRKIVTVAGTELSLNDIEHRILRPIWRDPRIHFAVNCASLGCPNLVAYAYTDENTEALLEQGAHAYINHPRGVRFNEQGILILSSIFNWYDTDFGASREERLQYLAAYAAPRLATQLSAYSGKIKYAYDWALNQP
jgi:hypothetical protein